MIGDVRRLTVFLAAVLVVLSLAPQAKQSFSFAIVGDHTGSALPGVYQHVWGEIDRLKPAFAINVGDSIQGGNDATAAEEWTELDPLLHRKLAFYPVPGNHDIWSPASAKIWRKVTGRPPSYSFDPGGAHITVLDNSLTNDLSAEQMRFLESDLEAHKEARPKLVFFHRPLWLTAVMFQNPNFPLHQLAKKYGVDAVVSGYVHRFGRWNLEGVEYLMVGSSGGQLRGERFSDGWFFHWVEAKVSEGKVQFVVHELPAPYGEGRIFAASEWASFK